MTRREHIPTHRAGWVGVWVVITATFETQNATSHFVVLSMIRIPIVFHTTYASFATRIDEHPSFVHRLVHRFESLAHPKKKDPPHHHHHDRDGKRPLDGGIARTDASAVREAGVLVQHK